MTLNITTETNGPITKISLKGRLDASTAAAFKEEVDKAAARNSKVLVLMLSELEYMASAGLRVLVFAKQKLGAVKIFVVAPQEMVKQTFILSGFHQAVTILPDYDAAVIEKS